MKAIVLFSGGLDSLLAAAILKRQGVEVIGLNLTTPFHDCSDAAAEGAKALGIELVVRHFGNEYMAMVAKPKWGYGKGMNPCIDCRIAMLKTAAELMTERGAEFVATGEVVGQRPNSQKMHQLELIARDSGLNGKLLRPLSAKALTASEPETTGGVDRTKLYSYTGRQRVSLIALARKEFEIPIIPQPSTGCLLCEGSYAPRVRDLVRYKPNATSWDAALLTAGRQVRISSEMKCTVARRLDDCTRLEKLYARSDRSRCCLLFPKNYNGAAVLLVTDLAPEYGDAHFAMTPELDTAIHMAGALALAFTKPEKYQAAEGGTPTIILKYGACEVLLAIEPDDTVLANVKMIK
ncbi:MAG: tRNA 4-thiouridine(8) synthase ThiI [Planctomycetia bacterium]|nr:tRNA 4-thiouridine(8) synthase ThiI [Planctomycetia bacterium]